jgi:hypothetical protein
MAKDGGRSHRKSERGNSANAKIAKGKERGKELLIHFP